MKKTNATFCLALFISATLLGMASQPALLAADSSKSSKSTEGTVKHVDAKAAAKLVADKSIKILDLRTPKEFATGRIPEAKNVDYHSSKFYSQLAGLDKTKKYLIYCASGRRSKRSLRLFREEYKISVFHLDGGMKAWKKAGLPVEK